MQGSSLSQMPMAFLGIQGLPQKVGESLVKSDIGFQIELPSQFTPELLTVVENDLTYILDKLKSNREDVDSMFGHLNAGNIREVVENCRKIGLTEANLKAAGGGILWVAVAIGIAVFLYAEEAR